MGKTKNKGDIAESKVMSFLIEKGYKVLIPFGEDFRFDLAMYHEGKFIRIQCKYDGGRNNGVVSVKCQSTNNWNLYRYNENDIDFIAVYHEPTKLCYFIPSNLLGNGRAEITLRIDSPKNNQNKKVLWAKDYVDIKI